MAIDYEIFDGKSLSSLFKDPVKASSLYLFHVSEFSANVNLPSLSKI